VRRRALSIVAGWGVLVGGGLAGQSPAQTDSQRPVFRSRTDVVTVTVSVMRGRQPVTDLSASDFVLTDNGVRQTIDAALLDTMPIDVTLALTGGYQSHRAGIVEGGLQADRVRALLGSADRLRMVSIGDSIRGGVVDASRSFYSSGPPELRVIPGVSLVDGLFYALAWPVEPGRRHLVVLFTEGSGRWSTLEPARIPLLAERADAVLHAAFWASPDDARPIQLPGQTQDLTADLERLRTEPPIGAAQRAEWRETYDALVDAVRRTGGTIRRVSDSATAFEEILDDFRTSYVLRYTPAGVPVDGWHEIKVGIARPGSFSIRARRGYQGR
jgi:hypothetical protein